MRFVWQGRLSDGEAIFVDLKECSLFRRHLHWFGVAEPKIVFPFSGATLHNRLIGFGLCPSPIPFSSQAKGSGQEAGYIPVRGHAFVWEWVVKLGAEPGLQKGLCIDEEGRFTPCLGLYRDESTKGKWRWHQTTVETQQASLPPSQSCRPGDPRESCGWMSQRLHRGLASYPMVDPDCADTGP